MSPWPDIAQPPHRPYGLYLVMALALSLVIFHLDAAPVRYFVGVGLLATVAGLIDSEQP